MSTMGVINFTESNTTAEDWITKGHTTITYDVTNKTYSNMTVEHRITQGPTMYVVTTKSPDDEITWDDATWILTSAFIIFTMQSGFGLLEAGSVSAKNEVNIMVKNAVDVIFGGLTYWAFGYGLSFGMDPGTNGFTGVGKWMVDAAPEAMGVTFSTFIFQLSFATTATTIVSGAMAERTKLSAYIIFSFINTVVYCIPAHWLWADNGFLAKMGCIDIAGSGGVHLVGGTAGLVATVMLGPRKGRYEEKEEPSAGNPTNCLVGMFMLWWGWLGFNCGSTFGISGGKWKLAAKSAVTTINASMGGGLVGILFSYVFRNKTYNVTDLCNSILGGLVGITAGCAVIRPWEAIIVGATGGLVAVLGTIFFDKLKIDDPVGALSVHGLSGIWGMWMVGLFVEVEPLEDLHNGQLGLFKGGGFYLIGVQTLACVCIIAWSATISFLQLFVIDKAVGLRLSEYDELMGSDFIEHRITQNIDLAIPPEIKVHSNNNLHNLQAENGRLSSPSARQRRNSRRSSFGFRSPVDSPVPARTKYGMQNNHKNSGMSITTISSDVNPV